MDVVEAYEAVRAIPGVCIGGDIFMVYDDRSVYRLRRVDDREASRVLLYRASMRTLEEPSDEQPQPTGLQVVK